MALNVNNLFNKTYWLGAQNYLRLFPEHPEMQCLLQLINSKSCLYEKNIIRLISRQVWKQSLQNKGILFLLVLLSCLFVFAAYTGWKNYSVQEEIRTEHQQEVRQQWESKPDKHPHRMAHYGYLIFRPRYPLSFLIQAWNVIPETLYFWKRINKIQQIFGSRFFIRNVTIWRN